MKIKLTLLATLSLILGGMLFYIYVYATPKNLEKQLYNRVNTFLTDVNNQNCKDMKRFVEPTVNIPFHRVVDPKHLERYTKLCRNMSARCFESSCISKEHYQMLPIGEKPTKDKIVTVHLERYSTYRLDKRDPVRRQGKSMFKQLDFVNSKWKYSKGDWYLYDYERGNTNSMFWVY